MIDVRLLAEHKEFADAVRLQQEIWGFRDLDLLPVRLFVVASKIGGHAFGAFEGEEMVAFLLAIPGIKPGGRSYLHSHMLGVRDGYRDRGLGRLLKLAQRDEALSRGVALIEWTFDPLEIKNAYFNVERLGAVVNRYVYNQYGITSSNLHGGLPTDRCVAEWYVDSERVRSLIAGTPQDRPEVEARVVVPASIDRLRKEQPAIAREIQQKVGEQFERCFERGLTVTGVERSKQGGTFLFTKWQS